MEDNNDNTVIPQDANATAIPKLADPYTQDLFVQQAPNALAPNYIYKSGKEQDTVEYEIVIQQSVHQTGLKDYQGNLLNTKIWGYGEKGDDHSNIKVTWPGKSFVVNSNVSTKVKWINDLRDAKQNPLPHLLAIDTTTHWCYALPDRKRNLKDDGIPLVAHLHGGHTDYQFDGNPEYFEGLTENSRGPRFESNHYVYNNSQTAGTLWYHDHALGITRLNVYTGLAGFYIIRDEYDTGKSDNPLTLPTNQHELAYCVQDRNFKANGDFYYETRRGAGFPTDSILTEVLGDHILVNGKLWPKTNVEPRHYRIRLLNGCDTRFMRLQFRRVGLNETSLRNASAPLKFTVIGSDQGFLKKSVETTSLDFMPAERLDIIFDFSSVAPNSRVIIENIIGDEAFSGRASDFNTTTARRTDRILAFDIVKELRTTENAEHQDDSKELLTLFNKARFDELIRNNYNHQHQTAITTRNLGLYGTRDEFNRMYPLLGTAEPITDMDGNLVDGSLTWSAPITENPTEGDTEIWNIYNTTNHAHPIHVHLVHFEIVSRKQFSATVNSKPAKTDKGADVTGKFLTDIKVLGEGNPVYETENAPKDMVLCYPGEVTQIKMKFDKPGRYVWHCHILSHEDHEMMRPIYVSPK